MDAAGLSRSWGISCAYAMLSDPGGTRGPGHSVHGRGPLTQARKRLTTLRISRLNRTASALAVYASQAGYPWPTQDSLPAAGELYRTGLVTRRIPSKGFWYASLHIILPSQVLRDAKLASWVNQIGGYNAHSPLLQDPHELASWVNQIDGYNAHSPLLQDPHEARLVGEPD